jgi:hypothetical protein
MLKNIAIMGAPFKVDTMPFGINSDFGNQVFYAEQRSVQLADWGSVATPRPSQQKTPHFART